LTILGFCFGDDRLKHCCNYFQVLTGQWRSQGEGQWGQLPPVGLDSGKVIVGSVAHAAELN